MAKAAYGRMAKKAFLKAWRLAGEPTLKVIDPIANWTLPAGVAYDDNYDDFIDGDGGRVSVSWTAQPATSLAFLPDKGVHDVSLSIPGVVTKSGTNVTLLWTQAAEDKVNASWGVSIGTRLYSIDEWETRPEGVSTPFEIHLSLNKRE